MGKGGHSESSGEALAVIQVRILMACSIEMAVEIEKGRQIWI